MNRSWRDPNKNIPAGSSKSSASVQASRPPLGFKGVFRKLLCFGAACAKNKRRRWQRSPSVAFKTKWERFMQCMIVRLKYSFFKDRFTSMNWKTCILLLTKSVTHYCCTEQLVRRHSNVTLLVTESTMIKKLLKTQRGLLSKHFLLYCVYSFQTFSRMAAKTWALLGISLFIMLTLVSFSCTWLHTLSNLS